MVSLPYISLSVRESFCTKYKLSRIFVCFESKITLSRHCPSILLSISVGMLEYEAKETDRAEFQGTYLSSYIDGTTFKFFDPQEYRRRKTHSWIIACIALALIFAIVTGIYAARFLLRSLVGNNRAQAIASTANVLQIQLFNFILTKLVYHLTDKENHRFESIIPNNQRYNLVKCFN